MNVKEITLEKEDLRASMSDKIVRVFTEPTKLFADLAQSKPKTVDWLVPLIVLILLAIFFYKL